MAAQSAEAKAHQREYQRRWYRENRDRVLAQQAAYRQANPEKVAEKNARWRTENADRAAETGKAWKQSNKDLVAAQSARARARLTPEQRREKDRRAREGREDYYRAAARRWRIEHPDYARKAGKLHRQANPEYYQLKSAERRARRAGGSFTVAEWRELLDYFNQACAYCLTTTFLLEVEHMLPLSRGGRHEKANIVPACRRCNARKYTRSILEFLTIV